MDITRLRPLALFAAGLLTLACGDDSSKGSTTASTESDSGGTDTDAPTSSTSNGTTAGSDSATGGTSSGSSGSGSSGGSSGGGATEVMLFGEVRDYVLDMPIADVTINVYPDNDPNTTADADGVYSLGPVPANATVFLTLPEMPDDNDPNTKEYWGSVIPAAIGDVDPQEVELAMIDREFVQGQQDLLVDQNPAVHDPTTAFMVVRVIQNTAINEGNVTITVDPPPPADTYYAPMDPNGTPMLGVNEANWGLLPVVVYYNIDPKPPGGYTITASHAVRECTPLFSEFPTLGGHITLVDIDCPPA